MRWVVALLLLFPIQIILVDGEDYDWLISELIIIENDTKIIDRNIIIQKDGNLTLKNSTIIFLSGKNEILVENGGTLYAINSTLSSKAYFDFRIYGNAYISNSNISNISGYREYGGLRAYSSNVIIEFSNIKNSQRHGVYIEGANPKIFKNMISNNMYGIWMVNAGADISGNNISKNALDGIILKYSSPKIEENFIDSGNIGIGAYDSKPIISNNKIFNNSIGIEIVETKNSTISDNYIYENKIGISLWNSSSVVKNNRIVKNVFGINSTASNLTLLANVIGNNEKFALSLQSSKIFEIDNKFEDENGKKNGFGRIERKWFVEIRVEGVENAYIVIENIFGNEVFREKGKIAKTSLVEYFIDNDGKNISHNPYKVYLEKEKIIAGKKFSINNDIVVSVKVEEGKKKGPCFGLAFIFFALPFISVYKKLGR